MSLTCGFSGPYLFGFNWSSGESFATPLNNDVAKTNALIMHHLPAALLL